MARKKWLDITLPISPSLVHWPDNPPVRIERVRSLQRGDSCTVSQLTLGSHTGTHMDAPLHFFSQGKGLETMPLEVGVGSARVIPISNPEVVTAKELAKHHIRKGERILLKTKNSVRALKQKRFSKKFVYVETEAAEFLAERRILLLGVDYLSVAGYKKNSAAVHRVLLGAGIWIVEGLDLSKAPPGRCELLCLPLRILESDGAPARAILKLH